MKNNKCKFALKKISLCKLTRIMKKLKKKKSAGIDGLGQDQLILGSRTLTAPLKDIINESITSGIFPEDWKEAKVTPVLKKGCTETVSNYRPVSCLPAASKVLESVVCNQMSEYLETNNLLPASQHGFRPKRSTMTAWEDIQIDWANEAEKKNVTGILLWDLSAAFDTLDKDIFCEKIKLYGFQELTVKWFNSFLTGRSQRVQIGNCVSRKRSLTSGVPQGGVISPLMFVLYVSDLESWLKWSAAKTYADDTTTRTSAKNIQVMIKRMEEDAANVLAYMASNGLVANASKTSLLILNMDKNTRLKCNSSPIEIKIGNSHIKQEKSAKLLGIVFNDKQNWTTQIRGQNGVVSGLNKRLFAIKRLKNYINKTSLTKVVDGLFTSKINYGVQLYGKVRLTPECPKNKDIKAIQMVQNKLARLLNNKTLKDKVSTKSLIEKSNLLSVNQINAKVKLQEMWKVLNVDNYPVKIKINEAQVDKMETRAMSNRTPKELGSTTLISKTCISDAIKIWNHAPIDIKNSKSLYSVKKKVKEYVRSLPI